MRLILLVLIVSAGLLMVVLAGEQEQSKEESVDMEKVLKLREKAIKKAEKTLNNEKISFKEVLKGKRIKAAEDLLRLGSIKSIPLLLDNLLLSPFIDSEPGSMKKEYPVMGVLCKFGMSIVLHILDEMEDRDPRKEDRKERKRIHLMALLCEKVIGVEIVEAYAKTKWISKKPGRKLESIEKFLLFLKGYKTKLRDKLSNYEINRRRMDAKRVVMSPGKGEEEAKKIIWERNNLTSELLKILDDTEASCDAKVRAVRILGEYRTAEAAEKLCSILTSLTVYIKGPTPYPVDEYYPVYKALCKIGKPATPFLIRNILKSEDTKIRDLSTDILIKIEGKNCARIIMESTIKEAKLTEEQRKRIKKMEGQWYSD